MPTARCAIALSNSTNPIALSSPSPLPYPQVRSHSHPHHHSHTQKNDRTLIPITTPIPKRTIAPTSPPASPSPQVRSHSHPHHHSHPQKHDRTPIPTNILTPKTRSHSHPHHHSHPQKNDRTLIPTSTHIPTSTIALSNPTNPIAIVKKGDRYFVSALAFALSNSPNTIALCNLTKTIVYGTHSRSHSPIQQARSPTARTRVRTHIHTQTRYS